MLSLHSAHSRSRHGAGGEPRIGLAVAGGGPIGGMYELGALRALDEALDGLDLTRLDAYVGVSSGAFLAAALANRIDTAQMCRIFITGDSDDVRFRPETFMRPAVYEYLRRAASLPRLTLECWQAMLFSPATVRWPDLLARFGGLVPTGLFDNEHVERFLRDVFTRRGRSNDFRTLDADLFVVAVDLDSGDTVRFGDEGWDDVPISRAIQASAALPGLYPPVAIHGRQFVDGALRRTMHASAVLDRDIDLMIGVNPLVAFNAGDPGGAAPGHASDSHARLASGGLPAVLSQTFRSLLQSRMQVGLARYTRQYPHVDQLVFEPNPDDGELFFTNAFSFAARRRICEIAYRNTLDDLRRHRDILAPQLARHGIGLRQAVIEDRQRTLVGSLDASGGPDTDTVAELKRALDDVDRIVARRESKPRTRPRARSSARGKSSAGEPLV
ncbi:patatin-like phospholipase family protein [Marilutibacter chinensis]|uniref:Patatin-like phospholipase family protein n=1 Tax=Marilutibacter chinensis TaxID=2912247 RepID=A0ABS9HNK1_9GAMM|nr:patatin-like phospholipase family protein [Lysobacter chinensis]MCF7220566.1 patatin-like phospholipase family protein [Lysobacter chinensis]